MNITKEKFLKYYNVQMSGRYNMITDAVQVMKKTGLFYEEYLTIISRYKDFYNKFMN